MADNHPSLAQLASRQRVVCAEYEAALTIIASSKPYPDAIVAASANQRLVTKLIDLAKTALENANATS